MVVACDESHDRAAVRGKDANKSLHGHMLPRSSGTLNFTKVTGALTISDKRFATTGSWEYVLRV